MNHKKFTLRINRFFILFALLLLTTLPLLAQEEQPYSPFQCSLTYPIGTNGIKAREYTNGASVNLLVGVSKSEKFFVLGGLSNIISGKAGGMQLAGISNHIGETGSGMAISGVTNLTSGKYYGAQVSGIWNYSGCGSKGLMIGGVGNMAKGTFSGLQLGGLINIADNVNGVQFSGLINKAHKVKGVQFATLVNIADENDFPIGFVNIIKNGEKGIALTYDLLGNTLLSFRSGGKYTYGILGVGYNHKLKTGNKLVSEAGYGIHVPVIKWFQINNEIVATSISAFGDKDDSANIMNIGYRLMPSFRLWKHLNLFGGASINYLYSDSSGSEQILPGNHLWEKRKNEKVQQIYVGYQIGLQYTF